ncbi:hypothetical protein L7F22_064133 [Adiantum nelumboides]|nr:hypothetical protein [Adiantum nelumboides]
MTFCQNERGRQEPVLSQKQERHGESELCFPLPSQLGKPSADRDQPCPARHPKFDSTVLPARVRGAQAISTAEIPSALGHKDDRRRRTGTFCWAPTPCSVCERERERERDREGCDPCLPSSSSIDAKLQKTGSRAPYCSFVSASSPHTYTNSARWLLTR